MQPRFWILYPYFDLGGQEMGFWHSSPRAGQWITALRDHGRGWRTLSLKGRSGIRLINAPISWLWRQPGLSGLVQWFAEPRNAADDDCSAFSRYRGLEFRMLSGAAIIS